jgi:hypothetical protein
MGAALLQHVNTTNQLSKLDYNQRLVAKIRKINNYLDAVLPNNRQLVMFLAGSGKPTQQHQRLVRSGSVVHR